MLTISRDGSQKEEGVQRGDDVDKDKEEER
jgi:hypothetical protein